jgi:hypothetical protein
MAANKSRQSVPDEVADIVSYDRELGSPVRGCGSSHFVPSQCHHQGLAEPTAKTSRRSGPNDTAAIPSPAGMPLWGTTGRGSGGLQNVPFHVHCHGLFPGPAAKTSITPVAREIAVGGPASWPPSDSKSLPRHSRISSPGRFTFRVGAAPIGNSAASSRAVR